MVGVGHKEFTADKFNDEDYYVFTLAALDDTIVTEILKKGTADIDGQYLDTVVRTAKEYTTGIFRRLREHEYDPIDIYFTAVGIINIPTEEELISAMEEMREKPLKSA